MVMKPLLSACKSPNSMLSLNKTGLLQGDHTLHKNIYIYLEKTLNPGKCPDCETGELHET